MDNNNNEQEAIRMIASVVFGSMRSALFATSQLKTNTYIKRAIEEHIVEAHDLEHILVFLMQNGLLERLTVRGGGSKLYEPTLRKIFLDKPRVLWRKVFYSNVREKLEDICGFYSER